jgi:hypothetical protein
MKSNKILIDEKVILVADLLTQIAQVNDMIALHQVRNDRIGQQTQLQYEDLRRGFLEKLNLALLNFEMKANFLSQAA